MATHGTLGVYELMADLLDRDDEWQTLGGPLDYTMVHVYTAPMDTAFLLRFDKGRLAEVREVDDPAAESADFVLTASPGTWRRVFSKVPRTRVSGFHFALSTGDIRFTGPFMVTYLEQSRSWEHLLDLMGASQIDAPAS